MSVVMRAQRAFSEESGCIQYRKIRNCTCCPYGYHIDLDFVRYCETLANAKPSEEQLLRRSRRRSRKSMEFMLGLENLFDAWDPACRVQSVPEVPTEIEPESPKIAPPEGWDTSLSMMRFTYNSNSGGGAYPPPFITSSSTCSSYDVADTLERTSRPPTNSPPETSAFMHDALDDVCSDFERTLERASLKKKNSSSSSGSGSRHNRHRWDEYIDIIDSCVGGDKPRSSSKQRSHHQSEEYETYGPVPPPPPPRKHIPINEASIKGTPSVQRRIQAESEESSSYVSSSNTGFETPTETYTLYNIRQQMALSLKRMKDLEEQVKSIPELQNEISSLQDDKCLLQQALQRKDDELMRFREYGRFSSSPSPCSPKQASPVQFTPQRISPILLESLGMRFRANSSSASDQSQVRFSSPLVMKRDVSTMCSLRSTRDAAVGSSVISTRSTSTSPTNTSNITDGLFTENEVKDRIQLAVKAFENEYLLRRKQNRTSIEIQTNPEVRRPLRDSSVQTMTERLLPKCSIGVRCKAAQRDACVSFRPETRTIGSSDHRTIDRICDRCSVPKRTVASGPDAPAGNHNSISLKLLEMPGRSATFSLGENEKLNIKRKTIGTQRIPPGGAVHSVSSQTDLPLVTSIGVQKSPQLQAKASQCSVERCARQTDTRDLLRLHLTRISSDEIPPASKSIAKSSTNDFGCNTDRTKTRDYGANTMSPAAIRHCATNTDEVAKRDKACGDIVKPHISIACAENYCDSCKEAIKLLAKDFSKSVTSPVLSRDSKIPRPMHITSPNPAKKIFMRQNTYTITPSPTPSPIAEKKTMLSSLNEKGIAPSFLTKKLHRYDEVKNNEGDDTEQPSGRSNNVGEDSSPMTFSYKSDEATANLSVKESGDDEEIVEEEGNVEVAAGSSDHPNPSEDQKSEIALEDTNDHPISKCDPVPRVKFQPTKEMLIALKVINDSLKKRSPTAQSMKSASIVLQKEWFQVSSTENGNPFEVEDYLTIFEDYSADLLNHIVNLTDSNGNTAMHYTISHGNFDVVSILLDSKVCHVNQTNNAGYTCVMLVSLAKLKIATHRTVVQRLFQMADVNIRAKKHCQTALMLAVSHGNLDMVEMLLAAGADINLQDEDGSTALMCAAEHGRVDIVKHLLSQTNCDSLIQDVDGSSAFKIAWQAGHRDIGLLLYVHEQMLRSKMLNKPEQRTSGISPRHQKRQPSQ